MSRMSSLFRMTPVMMPVVYVVIAAGVSACSPQSVSPSSIPVTAASGSALASMPADGGSLSTSRFGDRTPGVVYVTRQGLYYDTFVVKDPLPMNGKFQLLADGTTEFGPGQPGYLGGRWWEDTNHNGIQDPEDHYFLCPLLPPGRPTP